MQPSLLLITSLLGGGAVLAWRIREGSRPVTLKKIVIPPLGMSTGLFMFAFPPARIPLWWAVLSFTLGALVLAYPLIKTSQLTRDGERVMMKRSPAFLWILLGLLALRFGLRAYVEQFVNVLQTGAIFFLLAFGMIVRWRAEMLLQYRALVREGAPAR